VRLIAFGDSLTQGYGLEQDDGLVPQLQNWLRAAGYDVDLLNAGVSGDTTAGGLARIEWTLSDAPDAMIVTLGGNDLLRGIDPANSQQNLDGILDVLADAAVPAMLIGLPAPQNFGPEFAEAFAAMYPTVATAHSVLLYPDLLAPISQLAINGETFTHLMQDDFVHPNRDGVALIVAALGPVVAAFLDGLGGQGAG
jgi:acyl-CoA thioesterase-1